MSTQIVFHPKNECVELLRAWYKQNTSLIDERTLRAVNIECTGYPTEITFVVDALAKKPEDVTEGLVLHVKVCIPDFSYEHLRISLGCSDCGKNCGDDAKEVHQPFDCVSCAKKTTSETKFGLYLSFKCTNGTATMTLDAFTKNAEKMLQLKGAELYPKSTEVRRVVLDVVGTRFRSTPLNLIITLVPTLLKNRVVKWILKDVTT